MYTRRKKNHSGSVSIQVIDKSTGKYKVVKTLGSSSDPDQIAAMERQGMQWIRSQQGQLELDFGNRHNQAEKILDSIEHIQVKGSELLLGKIFEEIGFHQIEDLLFRHLVLLRIIHPVSKLKTTSYLSRMQSVNYDVRQVYYYLDKLHEHQKEIIQQISYEHTLQILPQGIQVLFYDVTTLYFETDKEDNLRVRGFSKDGKHQHSQIVLGLLVSIGGYPLAYDIFEGNKFEGHTMLPVIDSFSEKYCVNKPIIIADSGLLSADNIRGLQEQDYEFIVGARIRNEPVHFQQEILSLNLQDGESIILARGELKLVINYSASRATKDRLNRERGLNKLQKQVKSGKLNKSHINNRGYNKYLKMDGKVNVSIDMERFVQDGKWDGLKGYLTNSSLSKEDIITNYKQLWQIEKAFRITKHDLQIRPIYHRIERRIQAHVCIAFAAYKVYKELERQLLEKKTGMTVEKVIEIAETIYSIKVKIPDSNEYIEKLILLNAEQHSLINLFKLSFPESNKT